MDWGEASVWLGRLRAFENDADEGHRVRLVHLAGAKGPE